MTPQEYTDPVTGFRVKVSGTAAGKYEPATPLPENVTYNQDTGFWQRNSGSAVPQQTDVTDVTTESE
jgi:hypothetical protein